MLNRIVLYFVAFFAFLALFSIYGYHLNVLTDIFSILAIFFSAIFSYYVIRLEKTQEKPIIHKKLFAVLFLLSIATFALMILPSLVFPFTTSDFMNHAMFVKNTVNDSGSDLFLELLSDPVLFLGELDYYMASYTSLGAVFYHLIKNTYIVNTLLPFFFHVLILLLVFLTTKELFNNEKLALLSSFIYGFSLITFLFFVGGFFPQIMGLFFFIASVYCYLINKKKLLILSNIGLISYPPLFVIFFLFLVLEFLNKKEKHFFYYPIIALLALLPEVVLLFFGQAKVLIGHLHRGGITTPNPFSWPIFLFAIIGFFLLFKNKNTNKAHRVLWNITLAIAAMVASVFVRFIINLFLQMQEIQIHQLYMAVKYFYLLIIPLSIIAAVGIFWILRKYKSNAQYYKIALAIVAIIVGYHFFYGFNYALIINQNQVFPAEFYSIAEKLDDLEPKFTVGIDECFLESPEFTIFNFPYYNFIDNPAENESENLARYAVIGRALNFHWTHSKSTGKGYLEIVDAEGNLVIKYAEKNVNYFITDCSILDKPVFIQEGNIRVYQLK